MSVRIRLSRVGRKKIPLYRVVVTPRTKSRDGRCLEVIGTFNPNAKEKAFAIKLDRYQNWIGKGAEPSDLVKRLVQKLH